MKASGRAENIVEGGKFSVVPYGGSKPEYPNVRKALQFYKLFGQERIEHE